VKVGKGHYLGDFFGSPGSNDQVRFVGRYQRQEGGIVRVAETVHFGVQDVLRPNYLPQFIENFSYRHDRPNH
jgi:hypothetical protein